MFTKIKEILWGQPSSEATVPAESNTTPSPSTPSKPAYTEGIRLNLGCGTDYREGWVNVDMNADAHRVDLHSDVTLLKDVADQSCVEVLAQDVLEHIPRLRGMTALQEWNRVLCEGGWLTLRVPSLVHLLGLLTHPERQSIAEQQQLIQCLYGTQAYEGDFHLNGFTEMTLRHALSQAGFEMGELRIVDEWMFDVDAYKVRHVAPDALLRMESDEAFVEAAFQRLLGRTADAQGAQFYVAVLRKGIAREAVLDSLASSDEYRALVQQRAKQQEQS